MKCNFCQREGTWPSAFYRSKTAAKLRDVSMGAVFPWNTTRVPAGCTADPESLKKNGIVTHVACPGCFRDYPDQ